MSGRNMLVSAQKARVWFKAAGMVSALALTGCSGSVDRFQAMSFGSGYEVAPPAKTAANGPGRADTVKSAQARGRGDAAPYVQQAAYAPSGTQGGAHLASVGGAGDQGYLQTARMDLPPLAGQTPANAGGQSGTPPNTPPRTRTADGYGIWNKRPAYDGSYYGPRVAPSYGNGAPPPPNGSFDGPRYGEPQVYDRVGEGEGAPDFYGRREPQVYEPRREPQVYEPRRGPEDYGRGHGFGHGENEKDGPFGFQNQSYRAPEKRSRGNGKLVRVEKGDTLYGLALKHGVTMDTIASANNLDGRRLKPGQELFIPTGARAEVNEAEAKDHAAKTADCAAPSCHRVKPGETLGSIASAYNVPAVKILAANNLLEPRQVRPGQALRIPQAQAAAQEEAKPLADTDKQLAAAQPKGGNMPGTAVNGAPASPQYKTGDLAANNANALQPRPKDGASQPGAAQGVVPVAAQGGRQTCEALMANPIPRSGSTFRKPVEGLVIATFGVQRDHSVNEGITYSVPKGADVKAAENGVVSYVGDEIAGFGNLVLIRHADDYVTAYANNDKVLVKPCDVVKRGQVVAKAGATGDATQPQLHFEIRKNSKPVDPAPLLASGKAAGL